MVDEGLFEKFPCDLVYAMHNKPGIPIGHMGVKAGPMLASSDTFEIKVKGRGGHAAHPHLSIDPFVIGAQIVLALQTISSRNVDPQDAVVVSIGKMQSGTTSNVIPDELTILGTVRAFRPEVQDLAERRIGEIARGIAATFGAGAELSYVRKYPPTINHPAESDFAAEVAAEICGSDNVQRAVRPSMGSEDFSFMLRARPGAMVWLGNGSGEGGRILHNARYDFNDEAIPTGVSFFVRLAERYLERGL